MQYCFLIIFLIFFSVAKAAENGKKVNFPDLKDAKDLVKPIRWHSTTTWTEICHFLAPPPAWTVFIPYRATKTDIFDPLPPHLVHVVIECPLIRPSLE